MDVMYLDIHSHLADHYFDGTRDDMLARMTAAHVGTISVGTSLATSKKAVSLASSHPLVWACIGIHPEVHETLDVPAFAALLESERVVAVGECGFDFFRADRTQVHKEQQARLEAHVSFAVANNLPLMLHIRPTQGTLDAYDDTLSLLASLSREYGERLRGNVHFFAADILYAKRFFDIGFTISLTGVITFAREYDTLVQNAPLSMLHVETDAPFVAPAPFRGRKSEPVHVLAILEHIAARRGMTLEYVASEVRHTTRRVFGV